MKLKAQLSSVRVFLMGAFASGSLAYSRIIDSESTTPITSLKLKLCNWLMLILLFIFGGALLIFLRLQTQRVINSSSLPLKTKLFYFKHEIASYSPILILCLSSIGIRFPMSLTIFGIFSLVAMIQLGLIFSTLEEERRTELLTSKPWLAFLFFISGFAALIYQIAWQRALFGAFGVNIESITIIISVFMFGLGIGCLIGGQLAKRFPKSSHQLFLFCELGIGIFGIFSLPLIKLVSDSLLTAGLVQISLATYALLCIPTILMGATLPLLVEHLQGHFDNIGKSVGLLYCLNTVGSAIASFLTVDVLFYFFGLQTSIWIAALCNIVTAILVFDYTLRLKSHPSHHTTNCQVAVSEGPTTSTETRFPLILLISGLVGYISLSQEILWFRTFSYITAGRPKAFAYLLGFILLGIAGGAHFAKKLCERNCNTLLHISRMLFVSAITYFLSIPFIGLILTFEHTNLWGLIGSFLPGVELFIGYTIAMTIAFCLGSIFPMLCHASIKKDSSSGLNISFIYFTNILGSTAGPILTGFILLNRFSLEQNILILSCLTLMVALVTNLYSSETTRQKFVFSLTIICAIGGLCLSQSVFYSHILEKLQLKEGFTGQSYTYLEQNRTGIVSVLSSRSQSSNPASSYSIPETIPTGSVDIVFGGGIYDGTTNLDPLNDSNNIRRAYFISALHPNPKDVLEIGLSSGAWAKVFSDYQPIENLTSIEINQSYLNIIKHYPGISPLLSDPKVHIEIDDGRRWLKRNPNRKFDFILMNTTYFWRDHATNLVSKEFMEMVRGHLKPGGVLYFNPTGSEDVIYTASQVFSFMVRYQNFIAVSDSPFSLSSEQREANIGLFKENGKPAFDKNDPRSRELVVALSQEKIEDIAQFYRSRKDLICITEDNMASEFKEKDLWQRNNSRWPLNHQKYLMLLILVSVFFGVSRIKKEPNKFNDFSELSGSK